MQTILRPAAAPSRLILSRALPRLALCLGLLLCACDSGTRPQGAPTMIPEVGVVELAPSRVVLTTELVGRTVSFLQAEVRPQVRGIILAREFAEGGEVKQGQALYRIEPESYRAVNDNARAALTKAQANLEVTRLRARRVAELRKNNAVSQQDHDDAQAAYAQAQAEVAACVAALATATINLNRTSITAPISGRIGKSSVTVGALVTADQPAPLATIHQLDPMYVDVTQTAEALVQMHRQMLAHGHASFAEAADQHPLWLILRDGTRYEYPGALRFTDVGVNEATGTVTLRAEFPNPKNVLMPGLYVRIELIEGENDQALLAPQRGILRDNRGNPLVLVVKEDGTAERRPIKTGKAYGDSWIVLEGLAAGEKMIVDGLQRVRPGSPVRAVPFGAPVAAPAASPEKPGAAPSASPEKPAAAKPGS